MAPDTTPDPAASRRRARRLRVAAWAGGALLLALSAAVVELHREVRDLRRHGLVVPALRVEDAQGRPRTYAGTFEGRPYLKLADEHQVYRAYLTLEEGGPSLTLRDAQGRVRVRVSVGEEGGAIRILDTEGRTVWTAP
jgi:hypothetical protein